MSPKTLSFLVISDLHAHAGDPKVGTSYYSTDTTFSDPNDNPLTGIADVIRQAGARPDWIVCPGDLGDRADAVAQRHAWDALERIRVAVGAADLIGAVGNHDVDSRRKRGDHDPKGTLQRLSPEFPTGRSLFATGDLVLADRHWSRNYVSMPFPDFDCRLLLINSCGFHGFASEEAGASNEHLHGRLSPSTLASIRGEVSSRCGRLNIVLVHHHPRPNPWIDDAGSVMVGGDKLIEALKATEQQWIVVHGHQHVPDLSYADASPFAPVVLSSASVAAKTYPVKGGYPRNQIHLVQIPVSDLDASGERVLGTVTSWSWAAQLGWLPAQSGAEDAGASRGLPHRTGFGHRTNLLDLRDTIVAAIEATPHRSLSWSDVTSQHPKIAYLVPTDQNGLIAHLKSKGVRVTYSALREPYQLELGL